MKKKFVLLVLFIMLVVLSAALALAQDDEIVEIVPSHPAIQAAVQAFNGGNNLDDVAEYIHPDYKWNYSEGVHHEGIEGFAGFVGFLRTIMPDFYVTYHEEIGADNVFAFRYTITGTHTVDIEDLPATNNEVVLINNIIIYRLEDDKVVEIWNAFDVQGWNMGIGVLPSPMAEE